MRKKVIKNDDSSATNNSEVDDNTVTIAVESSNETEKPVNQKIVPHGILRPLDLEMRIEIADQIKKSFNISNKYYQIFDNGELHDELHEASPSIQQYLDFNKEQLESYIKELKENISDPDTLIYFNVGKQNRKYLSYDAYFSQNGLAPKPLEITNWMDYVMKKFPDLSEEEIAVKIKGNLRYGFTLIQK